MHGFMHYYPAISIQRMSSQCLGYVDSTPKQSLNETSVVDFHTFLANIGFSHGIVTDGVTAREGYKRHQRSFLIYALGDTWLDQRISRQHLEYFYLRTACLIVIDHVVF